MKFALAWVGLLGSLSSVHAAQVRIETYGDSISAGFMAGMSVTAPPPLKTISKAISDMAMFLITDKPDYIQNLHAPQAAWPAQLVGILKQSGVDAVLQNHAISGTESWALSGQVVDGAGAKTDAYFFVGPNDFCENGDSADALAKKYEQNVDSTLAKWDASHDQSQAFLVPVPRVDQVYATLKGFVWYRGAKSAYKCEDSWRKFFPYCPSYNKMLKEGTLEAHIKPRVEAMNVALDRLALKWGKASQKNTFRYLPHVHDVSFRPEYFSVDCYHLSPFGQSEMAKAIYKSAYF